MILIRAVLIAPNLVEEDGESADTLHTAVSPKDLHADADGAVILASRVFGAMDGQGSSSRSCRHPRRTG